MKTNLEHTWRHLWERSSPMGGKGGGGEGRLDVVSGGWVGGRENKIVITTNDN